MKDKLQEWETLMEQVIAITELPHEQVTHDDMIKLRSLSMKIATLVYSLSVIIWEMKSKYKIKYWESFTHWMDEKKTATLSKEIATYDAEKEFWEYRKMEEARDGMTWVLRQIEWFSVQWNMYRKEQSQYLESIK